MEKNENTILIILVSILIILNIILFIQLGGANRKTEELKDDIKTIKKQQSEMYDLFIYEDNELEDEITFENNDYDFYMTDEEYEQYKD